MRLAKRSNAFNRIYDKFYKFNYVTILIGLFLRKGYKLYSYKIISKFIFLVKLQEKKNINYIFNLYFNKYIPLFSFISKKIAANVYQLPSLINRNRAKTLLVRWFIKASLERSENNTIIKLFNEFNDLKLGYGRTLKYLEEHYKLALKNRPFLRFLRKRRKVFLSRLKKYGVK